MNKIGEVTTTRIFMVVLMLAAATMVTATATAQTVTPPEVVQALGITRPAGMTPTEASLVVARAVQSSVSKG
ncbi:MAG TPA: hypothetical protein VF953_04055, partial [Terriglobales bacterium]